MDERTGFHVEIADRIQVEGFDPHRLAQAARQIASDHAFADGEISLVIVGDDEIQELNRMHLAHDWPTDVISFVFEAEERLDGEIIVSIETAQTVAEERGVAWQDELLLYVIHGMLHLVGYDDLDDGSAAEMRLKEQHYLMANGVPHAERHAQEFHQTEPDEET